MNASSAVQREGDDIPDGPAEADFFEAIIERFQWFSVGPYGFDLVEFEDCIGAGLDKLVRLKHFKHGDATADAIELGEELEGKWKP